MIGIEKFTFNPFGENTYIIYNDQGKCWVIDAGCSSPDEENELLTFVTERELAVEKLIQTHCHVDHVFGTAFIEEKFGLLPHIHESEVKLLELASPIAASYGLNLRQPSGKYNLLVPGQNLFLGEEEFEVRHSPGHSPGSLVFIHHKQKTVIGGDVLFRESIGRSDLPGGDHRLLLDSIRSQLYTLPDDYTVYSGHGPETTIGHEKRANPFVRN